MEDFTLKEEDFGNCKFYDDVTGKEVPKDVTMKARQAEMKQVYAHKVYDKVPLTESYEVTEEGPVGTKWLEFNKGDEEEYSIRARLVTQEYSKGKIETIVAATPPWEAKKMLLSSPVTEGIGYGPGWHYKIDFIDTKRAYFYAPAKRKVYSKLPMEDFEEGICGKLRSLCREHEKQALTGQRGMSGLWRAWDSQEEHRAHVYSLTRFLN